MPAVIDAKHYPQIFDEVVSHLPFEGLMVLRGVSHGVRRQAERRMVAHVAFGTEADGMQALREPRMPFRHMPMTYRGVRSKRMRALMRHVRCVDYYGIPRQLPAPHVTFPPDAVIRYMGPMGLGSFAENIKSKGTVVTYQDYRRLVDYDCGVNYECREMPSEYRHVKAHGARRVVHYVRVCTSDLPLDPFDVLNWTYPWDRCMRSAVLVLELHEDKRPVPKDYKRPMPKDPGAAVGATTDATAEGMAEPPAAPTTEEFPEASTTEPETGPDAKESSADITPTPQPPAASTAEPQTGPDANEFGAAVTSTPQTSAQDNVDAPAPWWEPDAYSGSQDETESESDNDWVAPPAPDSDDEPNYWRFLTRVPITAARMLLRGVPVTIVGIDAVPPKLVGMDESVDIPEKFVADVRDRVRFYSGDPARFGGPRSVGRDVDRAMALLTLETLDDWRAKADWREAEKPPVPEDFVGWEYDDEGINDRFGIVDDETLGDDCACPHCANADDEGHGGEPGEGGGEGGREGGDDENDNQNDDENDNQNDKANDNENDGGSDGDSDDDSDNDHHLPIMFNWVPFAPWMEGDVKDVPADKRRFDDGTESVCSLDVPDDENANSDAESGDEAAEDDWEGDGYDSDNQYVVVINGMGMGAHFH